MLIRAVTIRRAIDERELKLYRTVKVIQKLTPTVEYRRLVFIRAEHIVYIRESDRLRIRSVARPADSIWEHSLKRNGVLRGQTFLLISSALFQLCFAPPRIISSAS